MYKIEQTIKEINLLLTVTDSLNIKAAAKNLLDLLEKAKKDLNEEDFNKLVNSPVIQELCSKIHEHYFILCSN